MAFNLVNEIRKKSREEWQGLVRDKITDLRIFIQENGELSAFLGLVIGICAVLFVEALSVLIALMVLAGFTVYLIAFPQEVLEKERAYSRAASSEESPSSDGVGENHQVADSSDEEPFRDIEQ